MNEPKDKNGSMESEQARVESLGRFYLDEQLDFDRRLTRFRYDTIKSHLMGPEGLELGPADGEMTLLLLPHFSKLTIVDAAKGLLDGIHDHPCLVKVHSLFEDLEPVQPYNTIFIDHVLEHVEDPVALIRRAKRWLAPQGKMILGVPNGHSIHRLAAVKMGLLKEPCELNQRDHQLGHRRVYTHQTFRRDVEAAGMRFVTSGGVFFKPLSNQQIQQNWNEEMIQGFYELGKDFPEHAAEIYVVCQA
jgi:2-polyprenyl-3-methyl-5-hydroxy-6-metoxy-1,4-benzoquinol methylase